jgi:hypothetical protein
MRSDLRSLAASLLLTSKRSGPPDIAYGVALWIRSRGKNIGSVLNAFERKFEVGTADELFAYLAGFGGGPWELLPLAQAVVATWDLVSEPVATSLLEQMHPIAKDHPVFDQVRQAWMALSLRVPRDWERRYWSLTPEERRYLAGSIAPDVMDRLPEPVAQDLWDSVSSTIGDSADPGVWVLFGTLASKFGGEGGTGALERAPAEAIAQLAFRSRGLVSEQTIARSVAALATRVREDTDEAIKGTVSLGVYSPRALLGQAMWARRALDSRGLSALRGAIIDSRVPADFRVEGLRALILVTSRHSIPSKLLDEIKDAPDEGAPGQFGAVPSALVRVLRLGVLLAAGRPVSQTTSDLVLASRNRDPRVRQVGVEAAGLALRHHRSSDLEFVVMSGLFDPQEDIVLASLRALQDAVHWRRKTLDAIMSRLTELYESYGREVRAAVIAAARRGIPPVGRTPQMEELLKAGRNDRSWLVRDVAEQEVETSRAEGRGSRLH